MKTDERRAWIHGVGMTPFVRASEDSYTEMGQSAVVAAMLDAGVGVDSIDEFYCGTGYGGPLAGQRIGNAIGLSGQRTVNVENACSSGMSALALAREAVLSGRVQQVLVLGIDKLSDLGSGALPLEEGDIEVRQGVIMPAVYAMRAARYLRDTEATVEDLALVSVKARQHGALSPFAQIRKPTTVEDVLESRPVADPLRLFMCCPRGDGAAAVVLSASEPGDGRPGVELKALELYSGTFTDSHRDMTRSQLSERTVLAAYRAAGIGPQDVHIAEVHDAFSIAELMYYEALGFAAPGEGWRLIREGSTGIDGRVAVNPGGGLLARGHPVGATGIAQVCELYRQVTDQAGPTQVAGARTGVAHCTGGGIAGVDHGACGVAVVSRV